MKTYQSNPKILARSATIIEPFRKYLGSSSLKKTEQYWTLAGAVGSNNAEIHQVTQEGLCEENQFFGVDMNPQVIQNNKQKCPAANWIEGKLEYVIQNYPKFNPAVVNVDHLQFPERAVPCFVEIFDYLTSIKNRCLLIFNVLLQNPYQPSMKVGVEFLQEELMSYQKFTQNISKWNYLDDCYIYQGCGKGVKEMGSVIFWKN